MKVSLNWIRDFVAIASDIDPKEFYHRWTNNQKRASVIQAALSSFSKSISLEDLLSEEEVVSKFRGHLREGVDEDTSELPHETVISLLGLSQKISKNHIGEWGLSDSPQVSPRGMRDLAHLVLRKNGEPMHFTDIASTISSLIKKRAHVQTVHNELIKDPQFVLVGRGLYALMSMGYRSGVVADVIKQIIQDRGETSKDDIVREVLKERYVKEGTILINLQNREYFQKTKNGNYILV